MDNRFILKMLRRMLMTVCLMTVCVILCVSEQPAAQKSLIFSLTNAAEGVQVLDVRWFADGIPVEGEPGQTGVKGENGREVFFCSMNAADRNAQETWHTLTASIRVVTNMKHPETVVTVDIPFSRGVCCDLELHCDNGILSACGIDR